MDHGEPGQRQGVLEDLIRALPAAIAVCALPGYFWTACLIGGGDRAERLAYSVALSMRLVPALALLQARLLGTGVTLAIAVTSALGVFAAGLGAYLRFGPAEKPAGPLLSRPSLSWPAMALILAALASALCAEFGFLPEREALISTALLVVLSGTLGVLGSRRETLAEERPRASWESPVWAVARRFALPVVLALVLARGYLGPVLHDWPYLRGGDQYSHGVMASQMLAEGGYGDYLVYPPGLHTLDAAISRLSGLEPLEIFPVLAPAALVLPALACYALAGRLWGWPCGVAAAAFATLLLAGPYQSFAEGRYPNLVSAEFLIVLAVAALILLYHTPSARSGLLLALLGSSVVLYHSVASFYMALLLALVAALGGPYLLLRHRREGLALLGSLALLGGLSLLYAWDTYSLPTLIWGLLGDSGTGAGGEAVEIAVVDR